MKIDKTLVVKSGLTFIALVFLFLTISGAIDQKGRSYTDASLNKALITFGIARGLNGVISVAQGTEIAIHPAGFGLNFTPGQILDPINDLIEQFSWVMLASSASLGIQKVFLDIGAHWITSSVLSVLIIVFIGLLWSGEQLDKQYKNLVYKLLLIALFVRLAIPVAAIGSEVLYDYFLSEQYAESTQQLEKTKDAIGELNSKQQSNTGKTEDESVIGKAKKMFNSAVDTMDVEARIEQYKSAASEASKYAIDLIVVFLIQTIIFPLMFLYIIFNFIKGLGKKMIF